MARRFTGSFTQQEALSESAIAGAVAIMQSNRLHRYDLSPDEVRDVAQVAARAVVDATASTRVELKWFGAKGPAGFTSTHHSCRYVATQSLPATDRIMATLFDMRPPLSFSYDDFPLVADLTCHAVAEVAS